MHPKNVHWMCTHVTKEVRERKLANESASRSMEQEKRICVETNWDRMRQAVIAHVHAIHVCTTRLCVYSILFVPYIRKFSQLNIFAIVPKRENFSREINFC